MDFVTHVHSSVFYVKEGLCMGLISKKRCGLLLMLSPGFISFSELLLFSL